MPAPASRSASSTPASTSTHPCFADAGYSYPAGFQKGDRSFTNNKVIVAKVFNNQSNKGDYTAEAVQEHGTHVAGTVACNLDTPAVVDGVVDSVWRLRRRAEGAARQLQRLPRQDDNARSEDILNALDAAYEDGMDVVNMSLGGTHGKSGNAGFADLLMNAVNNLDQAGMVCAVAAGNSGPGHSTVESPGAAARALTAGAMTVGHFVAAPVTVGGNTYAGCLG